MNPIRHKIPDTNARKREPRNLERLPLGPRFLGATMRELVPLDYRRLRGDDE